MSILQVNLLGALNLQRDGVVRTVRLRKALALLAYLAITGGMHSREEVVALLWPDEGERDGRNALRSTLSVLRQGLGDREGPRHVLYCAASLLGVEADAVSVDVHDLAAAAALARHRDEVPDLRTHLERAVALYRGPLLADLSIDDAPEFETWVVAQREHMHRQMSVVLARLAVLQQEAGDLGGAIATLERWVQHDPLEEDAHRQLIAAYLEAGDTTAARRAYEACRATLAAELGAAPSLETQALSERLQVAAQGMAICPVRPAPATVRALHAPLVGRATQLVVLGERYTQVCRGQTQVVVLSGEAGIGKTRLATEFLAWAAAQGADVLEGRAVAMSGSVPYGALVEVLRTRLERENAPDDLLSDLWLAELAHLVPELYERYPDLPPTRAEHAADSVRLCEAVARLTQALAGSRPVALFLDDVQWADPATCDLLQYLTRRCAQSGVRLLLLLTVQSDAAVAGSERAAWLEQVGRLAPTTWLALGPLDADATRQAVAALAGLEERAQAADESTVTRLGRWLYDETGGHPLFMIELLQALLAGGVLGLRTHTARGWVVAPRTGLPESGGCWELPRQVQDVIAARLRRLNPASRELLVAGAMLATRFTFDQLWRVAEIPERDALDALDVLVRARVLREEGEEGWYAFTHATVQTLVSAEAGAARRQVAQRRVLAVLEQLGAPATDLADRALAAGLPEQGIAYGVAAGDAALGQRAVREAIAHYERARGQVDAGGPDLLARLSSELLGRLYVHLGQAYQLTGAMAMACATYDALRHLSQERSAAHLEISALAHLAMLRAGDGDRQTALSLLHEALGVAEANGDREALLDIDAQCAEISRRPAAEQLVEVTGREAAAVMDGAWVAGQRLPALAAVVDRAPHAGAGPDAQVKITSLGDSWALTRDLVGNARASARGYAHPTDARCVGGSAGMASRWLGSASGGRTGVPGTRQSATHTPLRVIDAGAGKAPRAGWTAPYAVATIRSGGAHRLSRAPPPAYQVQDGSSHEDHARCGEAR
jgi:DNA-binding SARP family transcriptional activator